MSVASEQFAVAIALLAALGLATWVKVRRAQAADASSRTVYLAGGKLSWPFVAGAITLTNLSTDQLVGMNGNQIRSTSALLINERSAMATVVTAAATSTTTARVARSAR